MDRAQRAHRGQAKIRSKLIADLDPEEWDLPPRPKRIRGATYQRLTEKFDSYEAQLDDEIHGIVAKLEKNYL